MKIYKFEVINGELLLKYNQHPFDDCSKIYQVSINDNGVFIRTRENDGKLSDFSKTTYDNIEENFIPLVNFLSDINYLGLPASINCIDSDNNQEIINGVILYKNPGFLLVYDMEPNSLSSKTLPIKVIDNNSFLSYVVTGEQTDIYSDPKELYHDLFVEILENTKDMNNQGKQK